MKRRFVWLWLLNYEGQQVTWRGTCPRWASQPVPRGATLTRHRVLYVGRMVPCTYPGCRGQHPDL